MTQIRNLPLLSYPLVIGTNEDWEDSFPFVDASGNPIAGAGIALAMMVRRAAEDRTAQVVATTAGTGSLNGLPVNGRLFWTGASGNLVALSIPKDTCARIVPGVYIYEIQGIAEITRTLVRGAVTVNQGVVR